MDSDFDFPGSAKLMFRLDTIVKVVLKALATLVILAL